MAKGADGELGVAEEGGVVGSDEGACHVEDVVVAGLGDGLSQLLGLCLLSVRERFLHGHFSDIRGGFFSKTLRQGLVYKNSTNFRDAHTRQQMSRTFAWRRHSNSAKLLFRPMANVIVPPLVRVPAPWFPSLLAPPLLVRVRRGAIGCASGCRLPSARYCPVLAPQDPRPQHAPNRSS